MRKLAQAMASDEAEFVAIDGIRRAGKTFLVREFSETPSVSSWSAFRA
jgi:AAA+ ATPase superfamily predicted ATPase